MNEFGDSHGDSLDPVLEDRLRSARPSPDPAFVRRLEGDLFKRPKPRRAWRPAVVGGLAAAALASLALALGLAGLGPFGSADKPVEASDNCRTVVVTKIQRVPVVSEGTDGDQTVRLERRRVKRHVKRCH